MAHTIVIADDVTGANDIGIMYAKAGIKTLVYSYGNGEKANYEDCEVLIVDTDSRFDTREKAYEKVQKALENIPKKEAVQYIDKQCSVFRGNIGSEFDAMLDTLGEEFAVVVLGFPNNGRTTRHSIHYVHNIPLSKSQFRNDPLHPMNKSDLIEILQEQTKRKVSAIHYEVYDQGAEAVGRALAKKKQECQYCIMDVRDNEDLKLLASVLQNEKIICGSSALSEFLAPYYKSKEEQKGGKAEKPGQSKIFCMAGSLTPQTITQTAYMKEHGFPVYTMDTRKLLAEEGRKEELDRLEKLVSKAYESQSFVMIHSMNQPAEVEETKNMAKKYGYQNTEISSLVSGSLAQISSKIIENQNIRGIIVCGGDTSAALCGRLKIKGMQVLEEIEAGLPTCQSVNAPYYKLVLKSGSFGSPEFIEKAWKKLCE